jgi:hypothetical protein
MNSPTRIGLKSKKKYSGALFLENDEFDCFADHDESSEDGKNIIKAISRRESNHYGLSASRKFSKKIEEENNEESEVDSKAQTQPKPPVPEGGSNYGPPYPVTNHSYHEIYKGFFPLSSNTMGMNSIPVMPYMSQMNHMGHPGNMHPMNAHMQYGGQMGTYQQSHAVYSPQIHSSDMYSKGGMVYKMTPNQIMHEFNEIVSNQSDCKVLQQRIETEPQLFELVFERVVPQFDSFCKDAVTNYLSLKIVELSSGDPMKLGRIITSLQTKIIPLCTDSYATRILQKIIEKTESREQLLTPITQEIKGNVCMLVKCNNGNHVVQKLLSQTNPDLIPFVYQEILDRFKEISIHKHGCCVIQRCIDYAKEALKSTFVDNVVQHSNSLIGNMYGNYVLQYVMNLQGFAEKKEKITEK